MSHLIPYIQNSVTTAISTTAATSTIVLATDKIQGAALYSVVADQNMWVAQGSAPTATAGSGSIFLLAGEVLLVDGWAGAKLSLKGLASGTAVVCPLNRA